MKLNRHELHTDFAKKRKELEKKTGKLLFFQDIAEEMGVSRTTLWRALKKGTIPNVGNLVSICKWIGKPIEKYFDN